MMSGMCTVFKPSMNFQSMHTIKKATLLAMTGRLKIGDTFHEDEVDFEEYSVAVEGQEVQS